MSETAVTIDKEQKPERHWFKRCFYRKEGDKDVLRIKRFRYLMLALLGAAVIFSLIRGESRSVKEDSGNIPKPNDMERSYNFASPEPISSQSKATTPKQASTPKKVVGPQLVLRPKIPVPPASVIKAKLESGASDGPVRAVVTESLFAGGEVAVEAGTLLLGTGNSTDDRLNVRFNQMIDKDGSFRSIQAEAFDPTDKLVGLSGTKIRSQALKVAGGIGLHFLGAVGEGLREKEVSNGVAFETPSLKNALLHGAAQASLEQGQEMMSDIRNNRPAIVVKAGSDILVVVGIPQ